LDLLIQETLNLEAAVALFTNGMPTRISPAVEVSPLSTLPEALNWADFLVLDLPLESTPQIREVLGLEEGATYLTCPAQALVLSAMPCSGFGECGACSLKTSNGWKLTCKDGPVFAIDELLGA
jgi:hypothetical protein